MLYYSQESQSLEQRRNKVNKNLSTMTDARKDKIKRFGAYMPKLLQHIEEHVRRGAFHKRPLGPIGKENFKEVFMIYHFLNEHF